MAQFTELSNREREVMELLLEGKSNKQIALALSISERTVEFHLRNIYNKFQVNSRVELVLKLGNSTVADEGEAAENRDRLSLWNWAQSLREAVSTIGKEIRMENTWSSDARGEGSRMTFFEAIRVCLVKYAVFEGRATRSEFWWFALFVVLVAAALNYLSQAVGEVFLIAMLLPFLAAGARRLHDIGKSAWWLLFLPVPVGGIITLGFLWAMPAVDPLFDDTLPASQVQDK